MNEILNAVFKFIPARIVGKQAGSSHRLPGAKPGSGFTKGFALNTNMYRYIHAYVHI